jgi:hypothetical protein
MYRDYIRHVNQASRLRQDDVRDIVVASEADFLAVWNTLPESRWSLWQRRFEAGYDEVASSDRHELAAALVCNNVNRADFNGSRAA